MKKSLQLEWLDNDGLHRSLEGMADDLQSMLVQGALVNDMWECFSKGCCKAMDEHIPSKYTFQRYNQPWVNTKIKQMSCRKKKVLCMALETRSSEDKAAYHEAKKYTHSECREAYYRYINDMVDKPLEGEPHSQRDSEPSSGIWQKWCLSSLTPPPPLKKDGISHSDSHVKADILNQQYSSVFTNKDTTYVPDMGPSPHPDMVDISI